MPKEQTIILNKKQVEQKIIRIAYEIYENHYDEKQIILIGIAERGYVLAQRLHQILKKISAIDVVLISLTLDKKHDEKTMSEGELNEKDLKNQTVVLVDDVLNSGKTLIYGIKKILDFKVKCIRTVVLVNRRHRLFPVRADYVGLTLSTTLKEHITVDLTKGKEAVYLQ
jgi:pyrimidine operon attenuation protein / uracil phosphoribosyltransferase